MKTPKNFEDSMTRLEDILARMQSEETTLSDSVKLYAEAASLIAYCRTALDGATLQIDEIDTKLAEVQPAASGEEE